jgi:CheY-like chemotaxis protein
MGGRFALRSALGEGTSAELSIPLGPATGAGARVRAVQSLQLARGDRVLVVDDDATNRHVASLMLARLGLSADLAATGEDALAQSASGAHALVLLDLGLPDLDGVEVARALRAREAPGAPVPLYALTGSDDPVERAAALAAGVDGILDKPLRLDALRALVGDDLGAPSPAPSLAPPATLDLDRPRDQAAPH